ncbi:MAG TPA: glucose-6-phosphate dehydrogenase [Aliidongia sp.]|nr:glucose-6-phosphate dehydrogenase [Aliidongia sp.]
MSVNLHRADPAPAPSASNDPHRTAPNCAMVVFGAGGDLTKRLVVPALYNLSKARQLPELFALIGVDLADKTADAWRDGLHQALEDAVKSGGAEFEAKSIDEDAWQRLTRNVSYVQGDLTKAEAYRKLAQALDAAWGKSAIAGNVLFYLAVADRFFGPAVDQIGAAGLADEAKAGGWRRVVIEKPFGHDLASAKALNERVLKVLREDQIYRIDHFLGKETVLNIMAFRFGNGMFEPLWNRDRIDHVQITVSETVGVERRGKFYEPTGALRDMVPNHVFQLIAMTAMEPPTSFDADDVRAKKAELFGAMHRLTADDVVRGQYAAGSIAGRDLVGYRDEPDVDPRSTTETYVAMRLCIDNWRWAGVPFYLRTGKRMPKRWTEIAIRFKEAPYSLFRNTPVATFGPNWLIIQVQPNEGIRLRFNAKRPGTAMDLDSVALDFKYNDWFKQEPAIGYETLIYDCLIGDATLFQRADQVEGAWQVVQPALDAWAAERPADFPNYAAGSAGPAAADQLLQRDGRRWRDI